MDDSFNDRVAGLVASANEAVARAQATMDRLDAQKARDDKDAPTVGWMGLGLFLAAVACGFGFVTSGFHPLWLVATAGAAVWGCMCAAVWVCTR